MTATLVLAVATTLALGGALAACAYARPVRYRRIYPALSRACVAVLAALLVAHIAAPSLGVPLWSVYALTTLNIYLFAILWLPRLRAGTRRRAASD